MARKEETPTTKNPETAQKATNGTKQKKEPKKPRLILSLIPIITVLTLLLLSLKVWRWDVQVPLIVASVFAALIATVVLHISWDDIQKGIIEAITSAMQAILIACLIGMIIASWIAGGIVPSLIFYGLKILSPKFFLVTCLLVCSVAGVATGSSWTTAGTLGVAMIGIGMGMGIPAPITAGAVISGGYFGDKMSPFSDTTNLAPAMAGTTLFAHIRHMVYTTGVSYVIATVAFAITNIKYVSDGALKNAQIDDFMGALADKFTLSPWLMIPVLLIIIMIVFKIPAIPGLVINVAFGIVCAMLVQHVSLVDMGNIIENGFEADTDNAMVDDLLSNGGLQNMMWTVSLILCALTFGGIMHSTGMLAAIGESILKIAKGQGSLVLATLLTAMTVNIVCGEQYLSILITGKMYREEYRKRRLAPQNLSRALEDAGTVTSPLIPWTTCAIAMSTYLGVDTIAYLPFCFFNLVNPIVSAIYGFTGFTMKKLDEADPADILSD